MTKKVIYVEGMPSLEQGKVVEHISNKYKFRKKMYNPFVLERPTLSEYGRDIAVLSMERSLEKTLWLAASLASHSADMELENENVVCTNGPLWYLAHQGFTTSMHSNIFSVNKLAIESVPTPSATILLTTSWEKCRNAWPYNNESLIKRLYDMYESFKYGDIDENGQVAHYVESYGSATGWIYFVDAEQSKEDLISEVDSILEKIV